MYPYKLSEYYPRTIVFCQKYEECIQFNRLLKYYLGPHSTVPPGTPNIIPCRLFDMYTRCTEAEVKEKIMRSFCDPHGRMRLVIATIAFGMGLDCHNVRQILH